MNSLPRLAIKVSGLIVPPGCSKEVADTAGTEPAKASQASVPYQDEPKNGQTCAGCLHFIAESNTCKVVDGNISPTGWCALWVQKA